jgi:hypothetical protein
MIIIIYLDYLKANLSAKIFDEKKSNLNNCQKN